MEAFAKMVATMVGAAEQVKQQLDHKENVLKKTEEAFIIHGKKFKNLDAGEKENAEGGDDEMLELNVGGIHFTTYKSTLLQFEGSYFSIMFSGRYPLLKDKHGRIFVDRPPEPFSQVLDWMRNGGKITRKELKKIDKEAFFLEMEYFGLLDIYKAKLKQNTTSDATKKIFRVMRTKTYGDTWSYSGEADRIAVSVNQRITLYGIGLFGASGATATIEITKDGESTPLVSMSNVSYTTPQKKKKKGKKGKGKDKADGDDKGKGKEKEDGDDKGKEKEKEGEEEPQLPAPVADVYDVLFPSPIKLKKGVKYVLSAKVTGGSSKYGKTGSGTVSWAAQKKEQEKHDIDVSDSDEDEDEEESEEEDEENDTIFTFTAVSPSNGTGVDQGQIPALLWLPREH